MAEGFAKHTACVVVAMLCALAGCKSAQGPYLFSHFEHLEDKVPGDVVVEYGKPMKRLDRIGWLVGLPKRIIPWDKNIDNHHISAQTTDQLVTYLRENDLADVRVYVNHYDPRGQWLRMRENDAIPKGWRYTLGSLSWLRYTVFPGRVFGGDDYNPFTNAIYLNSDVPVVTLKEAAYAKDVHLREYPGSYVAVASLPVFSLNRNLRNAEEVFRYAQAHDDWELERQGYHVLYPQLGSEIASMGTPLIAPIGWWAGPVIGLTGAAVGHVTGRTLAKHREPHAKESQEPEAASVKSDETPPVDSMNPELR